MAELASLSARVYGRVQGVFFRSFVQQQAQALDITGYAMNLPDGTVDIRAEGEKDHLEQLSAKLEIGPPGARVDRVESKWAHYTNSFSDFKTRY